ncbi:MAG TPA: hypothetical protein VGO93_02825 [Candidatus Xenobia bacterium]|jgi:phosphoglycolate phosphatase-like HAD superfamily hydrolase
MTMRDCILALDFDGVVWDSVGESFQVASKAWAKLHGPVPVGAEAGFRAGRWLVRTGHDFYMLMRLLAEDPTQDLAHYDKARFQARLAQRPDRADAFDKVFYAVREEERENHPEYWAALQRPFPQFMAAWPALREAFRKVAITTTKDEASVHFLLARVGIEMPVLAKEFSREKDDQVRHLAAEQSVPLNQVILLDDLLDNLATVRRVGARAALATWGYNTPAEHQEALAAGIPLVHGDAILADLEKALDIADEVEGIPAEVP